MNVFPGKLLPANHLLARRLTNEELDRFAERLTQTHGLEGALDRCILRELIPVRLSTVALLAMEESRPLQGELKARKDGKEGDGEFPRVTKVLSRKSNDTSDRV